MDQNHFTNKVMKAKLRWSDLTQIKVIQANTQKVWIWTVKLVSRGSLEKHNVACYLK